MTVEILDKEFLLVGNRCTSAINSPRGEVDFRTMLLVVKRITMAVYWQSREEKRLWALLFVRNLEGRKAGSSDQRSRTGNCDIFGTIV
jgi:hypothetical protein